MLARKSLFDFRDEAKTAFEKAQHTADCSESLKLKRIAALLDPKSEYTDAIAYETNLLDLPMEALYWHSLSATSAADYFERVLDTLDNPLLRSSILYETAYFYGLDNLYAQVANKNRWNLISYFAILSTLLPEAEALSILKDVFTSQFASESEQLRAIDYTIARGVAGKELLRSFLFSHPREKVRQAIAKIVN